jgi:chaperone modulatory protein CbpM
MRHYPLARARIRRPGWPLEEFCAAVGLHPQLVRRYVALGLLAPERDTAGELWFDPGQLARVGRIQRLRGGLGLNYTALGVVLDLLTRIEELEGALRRAGHTSSTKH